METLRHPGILEKRLKGIGLSQDEFTAIISQPTEESQAVNEAIATVLAELHSADWQQPTDRLSHFFRQEYPVAAFFDVVEPILFWQQQLLLQELAQRHPAHAEVCRTSVLQCKRGLGAILFEIINRTLVLDLNVSRELGLLQGATPAERFAFYLKSLSNPDKIGSLYEEYPALFKVLYVTLKNWRHNSADLISRFIADKAEIEKEFGITADTIIKVQLGAGDAHNGGKSVSIITFKSGSKVVYKPRSLDTDEKFHDIIRWINTQQLGFTLKTVRIIGRPEYGWVEHIDQLPCRSEAEVASFHEKLGALLALLHLTNATDFHYENLIAHGSDPTLIDLETLVTPNMKPLDSIEGILEDSVLKIAILPTWRYDTQARKRVDLSGISVAQDQKSLTLRPAWNAFETDEMRIEPQEMPLGRGKNNPTLNGQKVKVSDYLPQLEAGFRAVYSLTERNKALFMGPNGFVDAFNHTAVRVLLRNTSTYGDLLYASYHPDYLIHSLDRDRLFDRLWHQTESDRLPAALIQLEHEALTRQDVPLFTTYPASRDLWLDHAHCFPNFYAASGADCCKEKIARMSNTDLERQCWLIRSTIASALPNQINFSTLRYLEDGMLPVTPALLLQEARMIGDRLSELAIHSSEGTVSWLGFSMKGEVYEIWPVGVDLYSGLPGIILFLTHLSKLTGEAKYGELAEKTLGCFNGFVDNILAQKRPLTNSIGVFDGVGGWIYFYSQLAALSGDTALAERAHHLGDLAAAAIEGSTNFDIINGFAGLILAYLGLHQTTGSASALRHATRCGEMLLQQAKPMPHGVGWLSYSAQPLTGFGHGTSGVALALAKLHHATADARFQTLLQEALTYERSQFLPGKGNWADLRNLNVEAGNSNNEMVNMTAWCAGATGVGLSRLAMRPFYQDEQLAQEAKIALDTTLRYGMGWNHSLCHGDFGSLEYLLQYQQAHPEAQLDATLTQLLGAVRYSFQQHGPISGVALGIENPGLMTGLAGIGYQLLRLARPEQVPAVLLLESL
ncbi:type 2 lanthipeptide synthetase LanM family protein [Hymenobacter cellulosilyticus]|uniref:Type 2 lanthipeptide synthetase LanM family protein n=1 Tax=Hymenobacter cellulosilyticus TaxID=2932248 RepID=A0A8T9QEC6_9BACT|nr:type 2 lanthipeptide synthetase LanM family protein [Hymenobacter cellulosilyticus]UOQ73173.1 type 2 lanthipeptide synthetase LanM family protein [Hymenobacter cellulosilyticus]